jgi:hypothetical protein
MDALRALERDIKLRPRELCPIEYHRRALKILPTINRDAIILLKVTNNSHILGLYNELLRNEHTVRESRSAAKVFYTIFIQVIAIENYVWELNTLRKDVCVSNIKSIKYVPITDLPLYVNYIGKTRLFSQLLVS